MLTEKIYTYVFNCKICKNDWSFPYPGMHDINDRCPQCGTWNKHKKVIL